MPDITMCQGTDCPLRDRCYRFVAKPDKLWQSYFANVPYDSATNQCEAFDLGTKVTGTKTTLVKKTRGGKLSF